MKTILFVITLSVAALAQNGGVIPPPDIVGSASDIAETPGRMQTQAAQRALIRQQTALLKQQTEALKQQNELLKEQQRQTALLAAQAPKQSIASVRKPRIDDVDPATGKPRFATYADYEDARDEWLIEEVMRRFQALQDAASSKK